MRKPAAATALVLGAALPATALANAQPHHPQGAALGFGDATRFEQVQSSKQNPAGRITATDRGVRLGILGLGVHYEIPAVDDFNDDTERLGDLFDELGDLEEEIDDQEDLEAEKEEIEQELNDILDRIGEDGYLSFGVTGHHLPFPLEVTADAIRGSLTLDVDYSLRGHAQILHGADLEVSVEEENGSASLDENLDDFGLYARSAQTRRASIGYGTAVHATSDGFLVAGGRLNHYEVELSRAPEPFDGDADSAIDDNFLEHTSRETDLALDMGVMWVADRYRAGATLRNLGSPSFDYPEPDLEAGAAEDLYEAAVERGEIDPDESFTLDPQPVIEGAVHTPDQRWLLGGALELGAVDGPFATGAEDAYQWLTIGGAYNPPITGLPSFRAGYRGNLAGTELQYLTLGTTLFGILSIDTALALEITDDLPRSAMLNVGLETGF